MSHSNHYFFRLLARIIDLLFVILLIAAVEKVNSELYGNPVLWYLCYNWIVILLGGKTIGKYSLSLSVKTKKKGLSKLIALVLREVIFLVLLPILAINLLFIASTPLHDRISGTQVIKNES